MSDQAADRKITGLTPRSRTVEPSVARLLRDRRDETPPASPDPGEATAPEPKVKPTPPRRAAQPAPAVEPAGEKKISMSVYVPEGVRDRSRAAYKETRNAEGDESYSEMIAKAIEAEVERRERLYHDGRPFIGGADPLAPGRPMQA